MKNNEETNHCVICKEDIDIHEIADTDLPAKTQADGSWICPWCWNSWKQRDEQLKAEQEAWEKAEKEFVEHCAKGVRIFCGVCGEDMGETTDPFTVLNKRNAQCHEFCGKEWFD